MQEKDKFCPSSIYVAIAGDNKFLKYCHSLMRLQRNNKFPAMYNPFQQGGEAGSSSPCGRVAPNATREVSGK